LKEQETRLTLQEHDDNDDDDDEQNLFIRHQMATRFDSCKYIDNQAKNGLLRAVSNV